MRPVPTRRLALSLLLLAAPAALPAAHAAGTDQIRFLDVNGTTGVHMSVFNGLTTVSYADVAAGDYHLSLNGGAATTAFCTDLWDEVYVPETWTATEHQTSAADGLLSAASYYSVAPANINAVDYIGQHYTHASSAQQAAAQLAIWDLVVGGQVSKSGAGYTWSSKFSETGVQASDIYTIEQAALAARGPQGSLWLKVVNGSQTPGISERPQDFVTAAALPESPTAAPEPSPTVLFGFLGLGLGGLLLRAHRRQSA